MENLFSVGMIATIIAILFVTIIIFTSYVKAPPDKAFIISGLRKAPKILIGKAGLKLPFFERKDELLIKQISIDIKTGDYVPTLDFIGVNIDAVAKVKIRTDSEGIQLAMKNRKVTFSQLKNKLGYSERDLHRILEGVLLVDSSEFTGCCC